MKKNTGMLLAMITIVSGSFIGFSPVGINLLNLTVSEFKSTLSTDRTDFDHATRDDVKGLREEVNALALRLENDRRNDTQAQTEPHDQTQSTAPKTTGRTVVEPKSSATGTASGLKSNERLTLRIAPGKTSVRTKFKGKDEELQYTPGLIEISGTPEELANALPDVSNAIDSEYDRIRSDVKRRSRYYAATHLIIQGRHISIDDFPHDVVKSDHMFVDFADASSSNPKIILQPAKGDAYALDKTGKVYSESELLRMDWQNCFTIRDKSAALTDGGWETWSGSRP